MPRTTSPGALRLRFDAEPRESSEAREYDFRASTGELRRAGAPVALQEKPRRVLEALLERPGELVTRDELCGRLWGDDVFVDFDANLNTAVRTLRRTLGDDASAPRFVETVPGRGYRFVAPVETVVDEVPVGTSEKVPGTSRRAARRWTSVALVGIAIVLAVWLVRSERRDDRPVANAPATPVGESASADGTTAARALRLEARAQWRRFDRQGYDRAVELYEQSLALEPESAAAWAGLAETWNLLAWSTPGPRSGPHAAFPRALEAAERAIALDPELAEAHAARAFALLYYAWDFEAAERSFDRALELAPSSPMTHHWAAGLYSAVGRHDEAIAAMLRAEALDPVSLSIRSDLGWYHLFAGRPEPALEACERTLADDPHYGWAIDCLREAHLQLGDLDAAARAAKRWLALGEPVSGAEDGEPPLPVVSPETDASPADVLHAALEIELHRGLHRRTERPSPFGLAATYAALDRPDDAFRWLDRAVDARDGWLIFLAVHPRFAPIADDPRFADVARRVGLASRDAEGSER